MRTIEWTEQNRARMIDQRQIPWQLDYVEYDDFRDIAQAITDMVVRGAPAIGVSAAFGMALAGQQCPALDVGSLLEFLEVAAVILKKARPTAATLDWAVDQMLAVAHDEQHDRSNDIRAALIKEAQRIADADIEMNKRLADFGATLINDGDTILHHGNTGMLATIDYGTALGVIRLAHEQGKRIHVLLDESRPLLYGSRLSAWECEQLGIPYDILPDTAAGYYMRRGEIKKVMFGAERVAANGDVVNKIGSYQIAVLARENHIPCYSIFPTSTIDLRISTGDRIPIEERSADEVRAPYGCSIVPDHYRVRNPAFDVTPQKYLSGMVTECGIMLPPFKEKLAKLVRKT